MLRDLLIKSAPVTPSMDPLLRDALESVLANPGRLARASLVEAAVKAHRIETARGEKMICAVEYFHVASLILDDLPCMDNAELRRGRPCLHRSHGEDMAILAALALINRAYALLNQSLVGCEPMLQQAVHKLLDASLGPDGLIGGQAADLNFAGMPRMVSRVLRISWRKTGGLFALALLLPAMMAGATAHELLELRRVIVNWSLAYQGLDDLKDQLASEAEAGKSTQRDALLSRPNLVLALGVSQAKRRVARFNRLAEEAIERLLRLNYSWAFIRAFHEHAFALPISTHLAA